VLKGYLSVATTPSQHGAKRVPVAALVRTTLLLQLFMDYLIVPARDKPLRAAAIYAHPSHTIRRRNTRVPQIDVSRDQ
jgi:hypothetical protein